MDYVTFTKNDFVFAASSEKGGIFFPVNVSLKAFYKQMAKRPGLKKKNNINTMFQHW